MARTFRRRFCQQARVEQFDQPVELERDGKRLYLASLGRANAGSGPIHLAVYPEDDEANDLIAGIGCAPVISTSSEL